MRKFCYLILGCLLYASCSKDIETSNAYKEYIVSLGFTGEIVNIEEAPFTKADDSKDIYGIQVYSCYYKDETNTYTPYAFGVYTDVSNLKIKLLHGYKYRFVVTMIVDGTEKLYKPTTYGGSMPFYVAGGTSYGGEINQPFQFSSEYYMPDYYLGVGHSSLYAGKSSIGTDLSVNYKRPNLERFYGELTDYEPSENGTAQIELKRTSYKLKVIGTGKFTEGSIKVSMDDAPDLMVEYNADNTEHSAEEIYTFDNVSAASKDENYSETVKTSFYWVKANGDIEPLITSHEVSFKRNKQTTITVEITDSESDNGIGITNNEGEITLGDNYTLKNGEVTDNNIEIH